MKLTWERRRILIWGKTRPEVSKSYREVVCTGGVFEDNRRLVRLYPIPLRYLNDEHVFKKYQWITAEVARNLSDPRPESYKIRAENIVTDDTIPTQRGGNWDARAAWILQPDNLFASIEALQERQAQDKTSLGIVRPAQITDVLPVRVSAQEHASFQERYEAILSQLDLPLDPDTGREIKPLRDADFRFKVRFRCDDETCRGHEFSILDWEIDALYFRLRRESELAPQLAAKRVVEQIREYCNGDHDTRFFVGNISTHPQKFTIVGLWYPKKPRQPTLFA